MKKEIINKAMKEMGVGEGAASHNTGLQQPTIAILTRAANARLIAAAPELLDALDDCSGVLQSIEDQLKGKSFAVTAVLSKARAAISKATGE